MVLFVPFPFKKKMVLGPHDFSIGARNCVVDQTLCTNKTNDDDGVNAAADVLCHVHEPVSTHIYKPFQGKELTLQFTCADMHTVFSVQILNLFFHNSSATECYNQEMAQPHEVNIKDVIRE